MGSVESVARDSQRGSSSTGTAIRAALYGLMSLLRPLISLGALGLLIVCVTLLLFSLTFPAGTHFPTALIVGMAVGCVAVNYGYGRLMDVVDPMR